MKNSVVIMFLFVMLFCIPGFSCLQTNGQQRYKGNYDSLAKGSIYLIQLNNCKEYLGRVVKFDSVHIWFSDKEDNMKKIRKNNVRMCANVLTDNCFNNYARDFWIINLPDDYYYDSVRVSGTRTSKDTLRFDSQNGKKTAIRMKDVESIEIYSKRSSDLEADPMNMCLPYLIFKNSGIRTDEYDLSELSNDWKAAVIRYLVYRY